MFRYRYFVLFAIFCCAGCKDSGSPPDLPKLYPCTISVVQEGKPLPGARVELFSVDSQKYRPAATSDASGNATLMTYGYPGAPAGKYKILVRKSVEDDIVYGKGAYGEQVINFSNIYNLVENLYGDPKKTPHEMEVTSSSMEEPKTVDVGKAIRVKVKR